MNKTLNDLLHELGQNRYNEGRADQLGEHGIANECSDLANECERLILGLFNER